MVGPIDDNFSLRLRGRVNTGTLAEHPSLGRSFDVGTRVGDQELDSIADKRADSYEPKPIAPPVEGFGW